MTIIREHPSCFTVVGLSAHRSEEKLLEQAAQWPHAVCTLSGKAPESERISYSGEAGLVQMIEEVDADIVINGIAGAKGLMPSVAALRSGKDLALANKETIVMAGPLVTSLADREGRKILPVDSEHSALFFLTHKMHDLSIEELLLTASGGAFRDLSYQDLAHVTYRDALKHPTWKMGRKITIDSASLANKGLEVIEAHHLFSMPAHKIKVVIHPQSCIHSLVRTADSSLYAQISKPDMKVPIQNALSFPEVIASEYGKLDLAGQTLSFEQVDEKKYPMLPLAYTAIRGNNTLPIVYNAANEIAAEAFLEDAIGFLDIARLVEATLEGEWDNLVSSFEQVLDIDSRARTKATHILETRIKR
jgi:1-deoxy-D-xylulose-5-phosphate reductoisomerase